MRIQKTLPRTRKFILYDNFIIGIVLPTFGSMFSEQTYFRGMGNAFSGQHVTALKIWETITRLVDFSLSFIGFESFFLSHGLIWTVTGSPNLIKNLSLVFCNISHNLRSEARKMTMCGNYLIFLITWIRILIIIHWGFIEILNIEKFFMFLTVSHNVCDIAADLNWKKTTIEIAPNNSAQEEKVNTNHFLSQTADLVQRFDPTKSLEEQTANLWEWFFRLE